MTGSRRDRFDRDGYVTVPGLLTESEVGAARDDLERCRARWGLPADAAVVAVMPDDMAGMVAEPVTGVAVDLLGGPVELFGVSFLCKPARSGLPSLWHQDGFPWQERLAGAPAVTVWVALDDADISSGCLQAVPGSHVLGARPLRQVADPPNMFGVEMDLALVDEERAVRFPMVAGDAFAHHPALVHSSGPNVSPAPRRAVAVRFRRLVTNPD